METSRAHAAQTAFNDRFDDLDASYSFMRIVTGPGSFMAGFAGLRINSICLGQVNRTILNSRHIQTIIICITFNLRAIGSDASTLRKTVT